jgi:hypothetical protein
MVVKNIFISFVNEKVFYDPKNSLRQKAGEKYKGRKTDQKNP